MVAVANFKPVWPTSIVRHGTRSTVLSSLNNQTSSNLLVSLLDDVRSSSWFTLLHARAFCSSCVLHASNNVDV